ncbi:LamG-like jellyroll fold domain-containing protein [Lentzea sp. NBRC 102530]|uniref:LamG-like jellyroll fold domain-containing protein n=1 Tax=Lentzea sp. NBRC 102530 TaxID=3032201 RepID=UPI0024A2D14A|nr:LamG-like jellyroll fold domain-containing protein [Lentzea sp. NBRC 102530]GLY52641.1 hypothetical protein Lesp01_62970 [Lentzea sp. NBRC 102530]
MRIARGRSFALPTFTAAVVFAGMLVGSVATASAAAPDEVPGAVEAEQLAEQSSKSIIIGSQTTEQSQVKANPDGSRTLVTHTHPVRVKQNDAWTAVNLDLAPRPDGSLAPKAAPVSMVFTAGGVGSAGKPVARLIKGDAEVGFSWDTDLPPVRISGQTATYPEVLPGVDLELQTSLTGFAQNLVVKTAEAARNPQLRKITFKSHTKNTTITGPGQGAAKLAAGADGLVVTGPDGNQIFSGDASRMWDSSASPRHATMGVEVGENTISITPDQNFLVDPNTTYPVRLDPDYSCTSCSKTHHAVVQSPWKDAQNYDVTSGQLFDLKSGYLNGAALQTPNGAAGVSRTYFEINTWPIVGKKISSATLHARVSSTYSCSPTPTELWNTWGINTGTTWNNQPGWISNLSENNTRNNAVHCPTDGGADFNAFSAVVRAAAEPWGATTFMFKAKYEDSLDASWRRFDLNPYLEVKYNSYPNPPSDLGLQGWGPNGADAFPCRVGDSRPWIGRSSTRVRLRARLTDPDGGMMDAGFRLTVGPNNNYTWNGQDIHTFNVPSGSFAEVEVPDGWIANDGVHGFHLWSGDYELSSWSPSCEFMIDTISPNTPAVSSSDYPQTGAGGSVGRTGNFTFSPNGNTGPSGSMDVARYGWSLNDTTFGNEVVVTQANGTVTVPITPKRGGRNSLYVQAYDKAGNPAANPKEYWFNVADAANPVAAWNFDETSGMTAADITGAGRSLTLNGATFGSGYANNGQVNTTSSFSSTSSPVVDTSRAFSVAAWVKLNNNNGFFTVASQDGNAASGFYLQYAQDANRWSFSSTTSDAALPASTRAISAAPPELGVWTHLLGTYDPDTHKLALYVNGKLEGSATATLWNAAGAFVVGAAKSSGTRADRLPGVIDHVQVWNCQVSAEEAARHSNLAVLRAHYNLDERIGTTTKDEVTGQNATFSGGVDWSGTSVDPDDPDQILTSKDKWLNFNSSWTGQATGPKPAILRTDRSYTVSAWVRHGGIDSSARGVVSMGDATHSPFILGFRPETGKWGFLLTRTSSGGGRYALSDLPAQANKWVHLAATFDATTGTIALYVDGVKQSAFDGPNTGLQTFNGSGGVLMGHAMWAGNKSDFWKGDVDDVRLYSGVLTGADIEDIRTSTKHR